MLLPKLVVTAYLAMQSQKTPIGNDDSLQQIQSPLLDDKPQNEVSKIGDYVVEVNGQPIATEHIDVKIPHAPTSDKSTSTDYGVTTAPHTLSHKYHTFDDFSTGKVDPHEKHHGATLKYGSIYKISDFPHIPNQYGVKKIWGVTTDHSYTRLDILFDSTLRSFVYNIGYILDGTLTAATFEVWYKSADATKYKLNVDSTWVHNPWKKNVINNVTSVHIVLSGFYSHRGVLAFYDWGYEK